MPRKKPTGARRPMSQETKDKISTKIRINEEIGVSKVGRIKERRDVGTVRMRDQHFPDGLFDTLCTGKPVDGLFAAKGGFPKATIYILVGDPGVGKTTVALDILADLSKKGLRCLYVSAEMTRIDMKGYTERFTKFSDLDMFFLGEYMDEDPKSALESVLKKGYDMVVVDSLVEAQSFAREGTSISSNEAEKWLVSLLSSHTLGNNDAGKNTAFLACQQVTKGGVFVGSNRLKHNTTGMLEARYTEDGGRMLFMSKNRRGRIFEPLWYSIEDGGDVMYSRDGNFKPPEEYKERQAPSKGENPFKIKKASP
jgi:hypothetical protein